MEVARRRLATDEPVMQQRSLYALNIVSRKNSRPMRPRSIRSSDGRGCSSDDGTVAPATGRRANHDSMAKLFQSFFISSQMARSAAAAWLNPGCPAD